MNNNNSSDRKECTIVCTFTGGQTTRHLVVKERVFPSFPVMEGQDYKKLWKEKRRINRFNPFKLQYQIVLHSIGETDEKSLQQQFHGIKVKTIKGRIDRNAAETLHPIDYILAGVISRVWDQANGKLEGSIISYSSNELNFQAKFDYEKNKYVIQ